MRRRNQRGLTLVELIVAFTILLLLTSMAVPLARYKVRRERERELRYALREIRTAIDKYKDMADAGKLGPQKLGSEGYPENLEVLVEGVKMAGQVDKENPVPAPHSQGPLHQHARLGQAQHAGRSEVHQLGRAERIRRVHQDHGEGARWNTVCGMVNAAAPASR